MITWDGEILRANGNEGIFCSDGNVLHLDLNGGSQVHTFVKT